MGQITVGFSTREDNPKFIEQIKLPESYNKQIQESNFGKDNINKIFDREWWKNLSIIR